MRTPQTRTWVTHANGSRPFRVELSGGVARVFAVEDEAEKLVQEYAVARVFVGKSPRNRTTERSRGYGRAFDGNSLLLRLDGADKKNRYAFVGHRIYEFSSPEPIEAYFSAVGNNDVPYPVSLSLSYVYLMLLDDSQKYLLCVPRQSFPKDADWSDAYRYFYEDSETMSRAAKRVRVKTVKKA